MESNDGENLATRFSIVADDEIEHLVEEIQDYQLSPDDDLPAVTSDSRVDMLWVEIGRKKTFVLNGPKDRHGLAFAARQ